MAKMPLYWEMDFSKYGRTPPAERVELQDCWCSRALSVKNAAQTVVQTGGRGLLVSAVPSTDSKYPSSDTDVSQLRVS